MIPSYHHIKDHKTNTDQPAIEAINSISHHKTATDYIHKENVRNRWIQTATNCCGNCQGFTHNYDGYILSPLLITHAPVAELLVRYTVTYCTWILFNSIICNVVICDDMSSFFDNIFLRSNLFVLRDSEKR